MRLGQAHITNTWGDFLAQEVQCCIARIYCYTCIGFVGSLGACCLELCSSYKCNTHCILFASWIQCPYLPTGYTFGHKTNNKACCVF